MDVFSKNPPPESMNARSIPLIRIAAILVLFVVGQAGLGAAPAEDETEAAVRRELLMLLGDLDARQYHVRQQAAQRLEALVAQPELGPMLAAEFQRVLVAPNTSLEVRNRLESLRAGLPKTAVAPGAIAEEEIDRLLRRLEDDDYSVRLSAIRRLEWLLGDPKAATWIFARLKQRLCDEHLPADMQRWLEPIYQRARVPWLTSDPAQWNLPPVRDAQIAAWLDILAQPVAEPPSPEQRRVRKPALRELRDLLARDEYVPRVQAMLRARLAEPRLHPKAAAELQRLYDLTRPAMVAEYWYPGRLQGMQHLLIGVPSQAPMAERPSHFDRIDDRTAHCASGQNLLPGDYPVGVAIPHPRPDNPGAFFHLVNLPTPRRRMAYECVATTLEAKRLKDLSHRTLDSWLAQKQPLSGKELLVLEYLDAGEVSRFAGRYFAVVADQALSQDDQDEWTGRLRVQVVASLPRKRAVKEVPSLHGVICGQLAARGTKEAIPGLLKGIEARRFLPPTAQSPRRLEWIAALAIAQRDPWPKVEDWLAGLIERTEPLVEGRPGSPELGATAAALLLERCQEDPGQFGLRMAGEPLTADRDWRGYRFVSPEARGKVHEWWNQRKAMGAL
jgi:hypothetical protein